MWEVLKFELIYRKKRPATYIYFGVLFFMCFMAASTDAISIGGATGQVYENSPTVIANMMLIVSAFGLFITSAIMGVPVVRDFEHGTASMLFTTPITKFQYLAGRFIGSFVVLIFVNMGMVLGFMAGHGLELLRSGGDPASVDLTTFHAWWYFYPFLILIIPNLIIQAALFFTGGALSKRMITVYTQGVVLLVLYLLSFNLARGLDNRDVAAMLDPFALSALSVETQYWTIAMQNEQLIPLDGLVLWNRVIWLLVAVAVIVGGYFFFSFTQSKKGKVSKRKAAKARSEGAADPNAIRMPIPQVTQHSSWATRWSQVLSLSVFYFKWIFKQLPFKLITICGLALMFLGALNFNDVYGVQTYPTTYSVLELIEGFNLFFLIIIIAYTGELIWKERDVKINLIYDAMPYPEWVSITGKFLGFMLTHVVLLFALMMGGIIIQTAYGYTNYEIGTYIGSLYSETFIFLALFSLLGFFIQVLVNQKFIGHAVFVVFFIATEVAAVMGLEHSLFAFGSVGIGTYSDMNSYAHFLPRFGWLSVYYAGFALFLYVFAIILSVRGADTLFKFRLRLGRLRLSRPILTLTILCMLVFALSGCFIYYNTNVLNDYTNSDAREDLLADYERELKQYETLYQPKITDVYLEVDLYPYQRDFNAKGYYYLTNTSEDPVTEIHFQEGADEELSTSLSLAWPNGLKKEYERFGYSIYELGKPLQPGDSLQVNLEVNFRTQGFTNSNGATNVVFNGTFFNNTLFPSIGYQGDAELSDEDTRRDKGLPKKDRLPKRDTPGATQVNLFGGDADRIGFEMKISTAADQIAIAPGYLQREWEEDGRKHYHYKMDAPMVNFYSVVSARYEVVRDVWRSPEGKEVNLEIYYHDGHAFNLDNMMESMKQSLTYYEANFSPYQYRQVRIMEFPRYASFAQSFANTIPYAESMGFIMEIGEDDLDMPFYITAHEVAHQWWGHQVTEASVQGGTMLSETLSQYSALMVMKHAYDPMKMRKFLKYEMDRYLRGRSTESRKEEPIAQVEGQGYIRYRKGSVVMYCFQDFVSEDSVNAALQRYVDRWAFSKGEYPTTLDLLAEFEKVTPDSLSYLIDDLFNEITLYENRTREASYEETADGRYKLNLEIEALKYKADSLGNEVKEPFNDWLEVGVFAKGDDGKAEIIYLEKHRLTDGVNELEILLDQEPSEAGIDPMYKFIDRNPEDNTKTVVKKENT